MKLTNAEIAAVRDFAASKAEQKAILHVANEWNIGVQVGAAFLAACLTELLGYRAEPDCNCETCDGMADCGCQCCRTRQGRPEVK